MRRSFARVVGAVAVLAALTSAGCGRSTPTEAGGGGGGGERTGTVGIAMPTKSSERWVADGNNMAEQFQKLVPDRPAVRRRRRSEPGLHRSRT